MPMTMNEDAILVFDPKPKIPNAKIVGNMIDMKKNDKNTAISESIRSS